MGSKGKKKNIVEELNRISYDVKAEAIVNDLIQGEFLPDDFVIGFDSKHKKNWEKDLLKAEKLGKKILLKLTRNGFVQSLPEYLFLKPVEGSKEEKEQRIEFNKKQLNYARYFFNPIESEIFNSGVSLEGFENDQITSLSYGDSKSIADFWRIEYKLNDPDFVKLYKLLPSLHSIVGNFPATGNCLAYLLNTNVTVKLEKRLMTMQFSNVSESEVYDLGNSRCGNSFVLGSTMEEYVSIVVFSIGSISNKEVIYYLDNGSKRNLIGCFVSYFIPVHYETEFIINVASDVNGFCLNEVYLGFNTAFNL